MTRPTTSEGDLQRLRVRIGRAMAEGRFKNALTAAGEMLARPDVPLADLRQLGDLGRRLMDPEIGIDALLRAHRDSPHDLALLFDLVDAELFFCRNEDVAEHLTLAESLCQSVEDFVALGILHGRTGNLNAPSAAYEQACALAPDDPYAKFNLAVAHGFLGNTDTAETLYDELIAGGHAIDQLYQNRSWLRRQTAERNHVAELKSALERAPKDGTQVPYLLYALGKELEDLDRLDEAFDYYERGAAARRRQFPAYNAANEIRRIEDTAIAFPPEVFEAPADGCPSKAPIFIVGMPRAGTTLLEQILGRHPEVFAAGELGNFLHLTNVETARAARNAGARDLLAPRWQPHMRFRELGEAYLRSARSRTGDATYFVDKLPANFMLCGAIARALPHARIIHMRRDPMDACFALFKQSFHDGFVYSYDQRELGSVYAAYLGLMAHWNQVLPGRIIEISYEDLVTDSEAIVRALLDRLDIGWDDACLDHTKGGGPSKTASAVQVRQPIHARSVGKWRAIEGRLGPLRAALEAGGTSVS